MVGLPGLVVQASDEMNHYFFELQKVEKVKNVTISEPDCPQKMNFKQYTDMAISSNKKRMIKKISEKFNIPENKVDISKSMKYETLDFTEK